MSAQKVAFVGRGGDARPQVSIAEDGAATLDVQRGFYEEVLGTTESTGSRDQRPIAVIAGVPS